MSGFPNKKICLDCRWAGIFKVITFCFEQFNHELVFCVDQWPQNMPDSNYNVFGRGILVLKIIYIKVKVFMVEPVFNMLFDQVAEKFQVDHIACLGIYGASYFNGKVVIMAMIIFVVAFAEYPLILVVVQFGLCKRWVALKCALRQAVTISGVLCNDMV